MIRKCMFLAVLLALLGMAMSPGAWAETRVRFKAIMVHASDEPAPIDRRLERIEYQLRRIFKFEHYKHVGEGTLAMTLPGSGTIDLGRGYSLLMNVSQGSEGRVSTKVTWKKGGQVLLSTSAKIRRGSSAVLGGAGQGTGKLIVTLQAM